MEDKLFLLETKSQGAVQLPKDRRDRLSWFKPSESPISVRVLRAKENMAVLLPAGAASEQVEDIVIERVGRDWGAIICSEARLNPDGRLHLTEATRAHILGDMQIEGKFWAASMGDTIWLFPERTRLNLFQSHGPDPSDVFAEFHRSTATTPGPTS
jgi:hypothetical protein